MYSYTIQNLQPSGDTFAIEYDGDTINGTCGPLSQDEVSDLVNTPAILPDCEYSSAEFADHQDWGFPLVVFSFEGNG